MSEGIWIGMGNKRKDQVWWEIFMENVVGITFSLSNAYRKATGNRAVQGIDLQNLSWGH